ncbi:MAG TPA: archease [Longimicrobiales bacterium]
MATASSIRFLEHTADVGVEVVAPSFAELLRAAGDGMFQLLLGTGYITSLDHTAPELRHLALQADDAPRLFADWLRELLYLYESTGECPVSTEFSRADARGLDAAVHCARAGGAPLREIKGVTYHQLDVRRRDGGWFARVIFDV